MIELSRILAETVLDRTDIPSQVTIPERKVLKFLAAHEMPDARTVVDLGSGAGSACLAMAEGFSRRGGAFPSIHAYDWFSVGPGHFATDKFKAISAPGDASFLEDFKHFLRPYIDHITIHSGDIKQERWNKGKIDILFVDLCKDLPIFNHVAAEFFPHIEAGSFLVHQDFSRPRLPWLHYSAGMMETLLEPLMRTGGSVFYRVNQKPSPEMLAEIVAHDLPIERRRAMARRGIETAAAVQHFASDHFVCLAELTDIYIDFWFNDRRVAKERYLQSKNQPMFQKFYPELVPEIAG